ncbi:hypothetical protein PanWU01x14_050600, partial [Parasponia andersonii]
KRKPITPLNIRCKKVTYLRCSFSVRVSNEVGAAHPRTTKVLTGDGNHGFVLDWCSFMTLFSLIIIIPNEYPSLFSNHLSVRAPVPKLIPLLVTCIVTKIILFCFS